MAYEGKLKLDVELDVLSMQEALSKIDKIIKSISSLESIKQSFQTAALQVSLYAASVSDAQVIDAAHAAALSSKEAIMGVLTGKMTLATAAEKLWNESVISGTLSLLKNAAAATARALALAKTAAAEKASSVAAAMSTAKIKGHTIATLANAAASKLASVAAGTYAGVMSLLKGPVGIAIAAERDTAQYNKKCCIKNTNFDTALY